MGFLTAIKTCFNKFFDIKGRASRSEYWWFILFHNFYLIVGFMMFSAGTMGVIGIFGGIMVISALVFYIPSITVSVRRFHDLDRSGWWLLMIFIPYVGLFVFIWFAFRGTVGQNRFGPDPLPNSRNFKQKAIIKSDRVDFGQRQSSKIGGSGHHWGEDDKTYHVVKTCPQCDGIFHGAEFENCEACNCALVLPETGKPSEEKKLENEPGGLKSTLNGISKESGMLRDEKWIDYDNKEWNFRFRYPTYWEVVMENEPAGSWMIPIAVAGSESLEGRPGFMINARKGEILQGNSNLKVKQAVADGSIMEMPSTPQEFIALNKKQLPEQFPGYEDISSEVIQIDRKPAARMVYEYDGQNGRMREEMVTMFGVGVTYQFICETPAIRYSNLKSLFGQMLESFRIGRKSSGKSMQTDLNNNKSPEAAYNKGVHLYQNGDFEQAYHAFEKCFQQNHYKLQSAYAMTLCQQEMGLEPQLPEEIVDREDEVTPVFIATNMIGGLVDKGFTVTSVKAGKTSEIEAKGNNAEYKIDIVSGFGFGGYFINAWRMDGKKTLPIGDSGSNPNPTDSDRQILNLLNNVKSLGIMPIPEDSVKITMKNTDISGK